MLSPLKKFILLSIIALAISSCEKDWNCACSGEVMGDPFQDDTTYTNMTKADAKNACEARGFVISNDTYSNCALN